MASSNKTATEEPIFKPQYPLRIRLSVYLYPLGIIACIYFIFMAFVSRSIFPDIIYAFIFGFTTLSMPMIIFRDVRFDEVIAMRRYFLPRRIIRFDFAGLDIDI